MHKMSVGVKQRKTKQAMHRNYQGAESCCRGGQQSGEETRQAEGLLTSPEPGRPSSHAGMLPLQGGAGKSVRLLPAAVSPSQVDTDS